MKIYIRGQKNTVNLSKNDFVSSGGEADIYRKGNKAYKIYKNAKDMIPDAKISELGSLQHNSIINPKEILLNKNNKRIGFSSEWADGVSMCKVLVPGFRKRNNITHDHIVKLVSNIQKTISYIHSNDILMIDGNEMNYIVKKDWTTPYMIDTNAWQTPSYPASVIMDSIRDWKTKGFSKETDWFSFAIISCWLFTCIHPFKGKHPNFKTKDIAESIKQRILSGVSIFDKQVRAPANVNIDSVPQNYKDWYLETFHNGLRVPPPDVISSVIISYVKPQKITGTDNFIINLYKKFDSEIIWHSVIEGNEIVKTKKTLYYNKNIKKVISKTTSLIFSPRRLKPILLDIIDEKLNYSSPNNDISGITSPCADDLMIVENTAYYIYKDKIIELRVSDSNNLIISTIRDWSIMPNSSEVFAGLISQSILGKKYITIPFNKNGKGYCFNIPIKELDNKRVIDAKHDNKVVALCVEDKGLYSLIILRFDETYKKYDLREIKTDGPIDINFTVLEVGVVILIHKDEELQTFSNTPFKSDLIIINDPAITTEMKLSKNGNKPLFSKGRELFTISMKK